VVQLDLMSVKANIIGQRSRSPVRKHLRKKNIFSAVTADGGRGCAINSFFLNTKLNMGIAVAKVIGATSSEGFSSTFLEGSLVSSVSQARCSTNDTTASC